MASSSVPPEFETQDDFIGEVNKKIRTAQKAAEVVTYIESYLSAYFENQLVQLESLLSQLNKDTAYQIEQEFEVIKKRAESFDSLLLNLAELVGEQRQSKSTDSEPELFKGIVDFPTAIANLQRYGSIIPTEEEIRIYNHKLKASEAGKMIVIFLLSNAKKIYRKLQKDETSTTSPSVLEQKR